MPTREIPADVAQTAQTARALLSAADENIKQAGPMMRGIAKRLAGEGWTQADIAVVLGVSKQRVSQLVNPPKRATQEK